MINSVDDLIDKLAAQQRKKKESERDVVNPDQELVNKIREVREKSKDDPVFKLLHTFGKVSADGVTIISEEK